MAVNDLMAQAQNLLLPARPENYYWDEDVRPYAWTANPSVRPGQIQESRARSKRWNFYLAYLSNGLQHKTSLLFTCWFSYAHP